MASTDKRRNLRSWRNKRTIAKTRATKSYDAGNEVPCWFCKQPIDMHLHPSDRWAWTAHHVEPINTGGHILGATVDAHRSCNSRYGDGSSTDPLRGKTRDWLA